ERTLFTGDENLVGVQFDGIETLMVKAYNDSLSDDGQYLGYEAENVIDCRGQPLTEDFITDLTERLVAEPNYGAPSDLWLPTGPSATSRAGPGPRSSGPRPRPRTPARTRPTGRPPTPAPTSTRSAPAAATAPRWPPPRPASASPRATP